jgi:predicted acyl esterase
VNYTLEPGHRLMVQVQSSWFPLYDRNPQTFVPNIFFARAEEAEQELDDGAEQRIGREEEESEKAGHEQHHDRGAEGFLAARPHDPRDAFELHLADEFSD